MCGRSFCSISVKPFGFCMSDAILESSRVGAMPMEEFRHSPTCLRMPAFMFSAIFRALAGAHSSPISLQVNSSMEPVESRGTWFCTSSFSFSWKST